jgi:hypothetical protein
MLMNPLLKPVRFVFYQLLSSKLKDPTERTPILVASLTTALLLFFNAAGLMMLVNHMEHRTLVPRLPGTRGLQVAVGITCGLVFTQVTRRAWVDGQNFRRLENEFGATDGPAAKGPRLLFGAYVILTIVIPVAMFLCWSRTGN